MQGDKLNPVYTVGNGGTPDPSGNVTTNTVVTKNASGDTVQIVETDVNSGATSTTNFTYETE